MIKNCKKLVALIVFITVIPIAASSCSKDVDSENKHATAALTPAINIENKQKVNAADISLNISENINKTPIESKQGEDIIFTFEEGDTPKEAYKYKAHYLYDAKSNTRNLLKLPYGKSIVGRDNNTIIYCGNGKTYYADLNTLKIKAVMDTEFDISMGWNPLLKETLHFFFDIKDNWLYYCELEFYSEIPRLYKLNILTGEKVFFKDSDLIRYSTDEELYSSCNIIDERGVIPTRGKWPFTSIDDLSEKWNGTLRSFSFGNKGLITGGYAVLWNGKKVKLDYCSIIFNKEDIYVYNYDEDKGDVLYIYDNSFNLKAFKRFKWDKVDGYKHPRYSEEAGNSLFFDYYYYKDYRKKESIYYRFDTSTSTFSKISEDEYKESKDKKLYFNIIDKKVYSNDTGFIYDFKDYEDVEIVERNLSQRYYVNSGGYANLSLENTFKDNYNYSDENIYIVADKGKDKRSLDLFKINKDGNIHLIEKDIKYINNFLLTRSFPNGKLFYNDNTSFIYSSPQVTEERTNIKIDEMGNSKAAKGDCDFYLGMTLEEAFKRSSYKDLSICIHTIGDGMRGDSRYGFFPFGDTRISLYKDRDLNYYPGEGLDMYFDEKSKKLYDIYVDLDFETSRGLKIGDSIERMKEIYGDEYKKEMDNTYGKRYRYTYKINGHYFTVSTKSVNEEDMKNSSEAEKAFNTVGSFRVSLYGKEENTRFENNEKFWLMLYDQYIDLSIKFPKEALPLLSKEQLGILKNAYYAKHGYIFTDERYQKNFSRYYWYKGRYKNVDDMLTKVDKENIDIIVDYENTLK